jgi:tRNA A-37 threonylcarbamoyl transferase component Bud32
MSPPQSDLSWLSQLERFEHAWQGWPLPPDLDAHLPPAGNPGRPRALATLVRLDLEHRWKAGEAARVEDYLARYPELGEDRAAVLALIVHEYQVRARQGSEGDREEYLRRFPDHAGELAVRLVSENGIATTLPRAERPALPEGLPVVSGYEILEVLGQGANGIVYLARQRGLDRLVALKVILSADFLGPHARDRLMREARLLARLRHPRVLRIHEVGEHEGWPFLSLELAGGGSLASRVGQPWPAREAAGLLAQLALAVHAAHEQGIVHRDLKPANVLLTGDGTAKVADFGLARDLQDPGSNTESGAILGTPCYMAPEQVQGESRRVGPPADVYALGAILYELLTGRPPFTAESTLDILIQVASEAPELPSRRCPGVPADLEAICLKCLAKEPSRRYASAAELADDLQRFLAGKRVRAGGGFRGGRLIRVMGLGGCLLIALIVGGRFLSERPESFRPNMVPPDPLTELLPWPQRLEVPPPPPIDEMLPLPQRLDVLPFPRILKLPPLPRWSTRPVPPREVRRFDSEGQPREGALARDGRTLSWLQSYNGVVFQPVEGGNAVEILAGRARLTRLALAPEGHLALVFDEKGRAEFVRPDRGKPPGIDPSQLAGSSATCFSPDGRWLATGFREGDVVLWRLATGELVTRFPARQSAVSLLAFTVDGSALATATEDGEIDVYALPGGPRLAHLEVKHPRALALSPCGAVLAVGTAYGELLLHEVVSGGRAASGHLGKADVKGLTFSPDGRLLAALQADGRVSMRDGITGLEGPNLASPPTPVLWLGFALNGKQLLGATTGRDSRKIVRWVFSTRPGPARSLSHEERKQAWTDLAGQDAPRAALAVAGLLGDEDRDASFVRSLLGPSAVPPLANKRVLLRVTRLLELRATPRSCSTLRELTGRDRPDWLRQPARAALKRLALRGVTPGNKD